MNRDQYYLLNASSEQIENLQALLNSKNKATELIAINMMKTGGVPPQLVESLFNLYLENRTLYTRFFPTGRKVIGLKSEIEYLFEAFGYEALVFNQKYVSYFKDSGAAFATLKSIGADLNRYAAHFSIDFVFNSGVFDDSACVKSIRKRMVEGYLQLNLSRSGIKKLPSVIGEFDRLERLSLSDNEIPLLPKSFANFSKLYELVLSNNLLSDFPPEIERLESLQHLDLSKNKLEEVLFDFINPQGLLWLNLSDNAIRQIPPTIGYLSGLSMLDLSNNKITQLPDDFGNLESLEDLNLSGNMIEFIPKSISNLHHLKLVKIANTPIAKNDKKMAELKKMLPPECKLVVE